MSRRRPSCNNDSNARRSELPSVSPEPLQWLGDGEARSILDRNFFSSAMPANHGLLVSASRALFATKFRFDAQGERMANGGDGNDDNERNKQAAAVILKTARSPKKPNVFFLGPYGHRVSFASQQRRALNLVWALQWAKEWPDKKVKPRPKVAVVGGGIAGVMAAAALVMLKCDVRLYEAADEPLNLQQLTEHRTVHPTINFWPEEALSCTTRFPFFDWYPGTARDVIKILAREWRLFEDRLTRFVPFTSVEDYGWKDGQVVLKFANGQSDVADIAIVASGFGKEKNLNDSKQPTYWQKDTVDARARQEEAGRFLVSGTGDGGLIDVLRLIYPDFMIEERSVALLRLVGEEFQKDADDIEKAAQAEPDVNRRAKLYEEKYRALATCLPGIARNLLVPSRVRHDIELVGKHATPYLQRSAPVHKLALAYAQNQELFRFTRGEVSRERRAYFLKKYRGRKTPLARDIIVIRHGTHDPLVRLLGKAEAKRLRERQEDLGDLLHLAQFEPDFFLKRPDIYPAWGSAKFAGSRAELARPFVKKRHGLHIEAKKARSARNSEAWTYGDDYILEAVRDPRRSIQDAARFPSLIFGLRSWVSPDIEEDEADDLIGVT